MTAPIPEPGSRPDHRCDIGQHPGDPGRLGLASMGYRDAFPDWLLIEHDINHQHDRAAFVLRRQLVEDAFAAGDGVVWTPETKVWVEYRWRTPGKPAAQWPETTAPGAEQPAAPYPSPGPVPMWLHIRHQDPGGQSHEVRLDPHHVAVFLESTSTRASFINRATIAAFEAQFQGFDVD